MDAKPGTIIEYNGEKMKTAKILDELLSHLIFDSWQLNEIRDKIVNNAKEICELTNLILEYQSTSSMEAISDKTYLLKKENRKLNEKYSLYIKLEKVLKEYPKEYVVGCAVKEYHKKEYGLFDKRENYLSALNVVIEKLSGI